MWVKEKVLIAGATIDEMEQAERTIHLQLLQLEQVFAAITRPRSRCQPRGLLNESSVRLHVPGAYPKVEGEMRGTLNCPPSPACPSPLPALDLPLTHTTVSSFLSSYYVMLHDMRENVKRWRTGLQAVADRV